MLKFNTGNYWDDSVRRKEPSTRLAKLGCLLVMKIVESVQIFVKLRQGSGKDWQGMAIKAKGLKASTLA